MVLLKWKMRVYRRGPFTILCWNDLCFRQTSSCMQVWLKFPWSFKNELHFVFPLYPSSGKWPGEWGMLAPSAEVSVMSLSQPLWEEQLAHMFYTSALKTVLKMDLLWILLPALAIWFIYEEVVRAYRAAGEGNGICLPFKSAFSMAGRLLRGGGGG